MARPLTPPNSSPNILHHFYYINAYIITFFSGHPENPERIAKVKSRFIEYNLLNRMKALSTRAATDEEILLVHTSSHLKSMKDIVQSEDLQEASNKFNSVYFHPSTFECASVSAGCVLQVVDEVLNGLSRSGVCVVRPPGHHAESGKSSESRELSFTRYLYESRVQSRHHISHR